jgi:azurin
MRCALLTVLVIASISTLRAEDKEITLKPSMTNPMMFDNNAFSVKAGDKVKLTFDNTKFVAPLPHNVVVCKPGSKDKVIAASNAMLTDPNGMAKSYVPESTDVLAKMMFVQPGQTGVVEFTAPAEAGDYPFICTFVGHAILMNGIMKVEK